MTDRESTSYGSAVVIGRQHRLLQQNGQDSAIAGATPGGNYYGLVADGCGSKFRLNDCVHPSHNEIGSRLLSRFAASWLESELDADNGLDSLPDRLYDACLTFLRQLLCSFTFADNQTAARQFNATHLLSTLLGFVVSNQEALFFWLGDGFLCHNRNVTSLIADDQPDYLAYRLLDNDPSEGALRPGFNTLALNRAELHWLAVATDGWTSALLAELEPALTGPQQQRWMNIQARKPGQFEDDGAIALCALP